ncbi:efflux RND transporter periplasmic adaptor subunit [Sulfuriflexus sp.]|uniref:efflux RND transporter periplasmic adaptor subunit n=1 Tax=Sulfuriflexus sp. TaxID=2015443 RepID=UPI0028CFACC6|nr:efflux RND transporter periplasmic adaptor subunit [Sulfuriflexus sp.]MDT8403190.1 efflux RND transporter periplasmic adaptor subunit [Sulfuriflexus sp.]
MNRNNFLTLLVVSAAAISIWLIINNTDSYDHAEELHQDSVVEIPKGPHGGKLFTKNDFAIELTLYETGVPPEFHVYAYNGGKALAPDAIDLQVELTRLDGQVDRFTFEPLMEYQRGQPEVAEPHSFDVSIVARYKDKSYQWKFSSYEGRTVIPGVMAKQAGVETEPAGAAVLTETLSLTGRVQVDPTRMAQVRARFNGVVQRVNRNLGERVKKGDVLATVQSNESLQVYSVKAPIDGLILRRDVQVGSITGDSPLFVVAGLSQVWVELDVFSRDMSRVKPGQDVTIETLDGKSITGSIEWVSPLAAHASQSVQARVVLDNVNGQLRPGQFVRGQLTVAEHPVALAVRQSAIQGFRDFQVVFARIGDTYEVRMLKLGRQNDEWAEVLGGLKPGTEYVTSNSYLIKADIEKSGASHDH